MASNRGDSSSPPTPGWVLPMLVIAQLFGVSLWFSSSAALPSLTADWGLSTADGGLLISAVQVGFIIGTLLFALTNLSDIFPASKVFLACALIGATANLLFGYTASGLGEALVYRFVTGLSLAGIYPVGMKVVVSWSPGGIGNALGWLIGALTLGTASPFLLASAGTQLPWQSIFMFASLLAILAGLMVAWVGDGPNLGSAGKFDLRMLYRVFAIRGYRRAALGYFGHMWELYAFWVISPLLVRTALEGLGWNQPHWVSLWTFAVIGIGAVGCVGGGLLSSRMGSRAVASVSMAVSGTMCVLAPLLIMVHPLLFLEGLLIWGIFVVSDSAQFSAMSAVACPREYVGTALTVQNSIGFAITILSIEWVTRLWESLGPQVAWLLAPGPLLGLVLLNWRASKDIAVDWAESGGKHSIEDVVAYPLLGVTAPERSGGPSLF